MNNNCFFKQLDREISDNNFLIFGEVLIENVSSAVFGASGKSFYMIPKSGTVTLNGAEITGKTSFTGEATITAADASFIIGNYYNLEKGVIDAEHFSFVNSPVVFGIRGDLAKFVSMAKPSMTRISFNEDNITNQVELLRILSYTPNVTYVETHFTSFTATMQEIGQSMPLACTEWWVPFNVATITGTIESFVQAMRTRQAAAGVSRTGSMALQDINLPNVTFNGETHGWQSTTLSWTESTITCYGVTVNA